MVTAAVPTHAAALYTGTLRHRRFAPRAHAFEYSLFMVLVDVDRVREAMAVSRLTAYNRWNWAAFHESDHVGDARLRLRERLRDSARASGLNLPGGPIYLLTHLRYAGYLFNPISLYYCCDRDGVPRLVMADVSNTYGGRHQYWLEPPDDAPRRLRATAAKALYVSPFMDHRVDYEFFLTPPSDHLVAHIVVHAQDAAARGAGADAPGEGRAHGGHRGIFDATLTLRREAWTPRNLRRVLLRHPWMTAKVTAAIHWEALRLRLKSIPVVPFTPCADRHGADWHDADRHGADAQGAAPHATPRGDA